MFLAALAAIAVIVVVTPLINVSRYKARITQLVEASLGRPVRLSSVNVSLFPRLGFVLTDLSVAEDPAYGAEPVLHANTVTASLRLLSLWRGKLEIGRVSVDEASLNLVRTGPGQWNLDPLFRTAAAKTGAVAGAAPRRALRLPYLVATDSRINFKNGSEKLPFSLVNADLSFWQADNGAWHIRLRGQPARTDVSLDMADTGTVRLEGTVQPAAGLSQMPAHVDVEWREAQLGQLARLVTGSDPGWRGDLTGELHMDGTANAARITARLRATGVHRAEFAPQTPLDFDANCSLVYHYTEHSLENLLCSSPLGSGKILLTGGIAGPGAQPRLQIDLNHLPVAAVLDALRTIRSGIDNSLEATGTVTGNLAFHAASSQAATPLSTKRTPQKSATPPEPLSGSLTVDDLELHDGGLIQPLHVPGFTLQTAALKPGQPVTLDGSAAVAAGGGVPLSIGIELSLSGYQISLRGPIALTQARGWMHAAGIGQESIFESLAGDPALLDLSAGGVWLPSSAAGVAASGKSTTSLNGVPAADTLHGTITLRNANWGANYLASHILLSQATLHLEGSGARWDPVSFSFGPLKGTASVNLPASCGNQADCVPGFDVQLGALDAATIQYALLGAHQTGTLLSTLISRLRPTPSPDWPRIDATVKAGSLSIGPLTLEKPVVVLRIFPAAAEIDSLDAALCGGRVHLSGSIERPATVTEKPGYTLEGSLQHLNAASAAGVLGLARAAGKIDADGKVELSGYSDQELAASAAGTLHFAWKNGSIGGQGKGKSAAAQNHIQIPAALSRFGRWSGDGRIAGGKIDFPASRVESKSQTQAVAATVVFGAPAGMSFETAEKAPSAKP